MRPRTSKEKLIGVKATARTAEGIQACTWSHRQKEWREIRPTVECTLTLHKPKNFVGCFSGRVEELEYTRVHKYIHTRWLELYEKEGKEKKKKKREEIKREWTNSGRCNPRLDSRRTRTHRARIRLVTHPVHATVVSFCQANWRCEPRHVLQRPRENNTCLHTAGSHSLTSGGIVHEARAAAASPFLAFSPSIVAHARSFPSAFDFLSLYLPSVFFSPTLSLSLFLFSHIFSLREVLSSGFFSGFVEVTFDFFKEAENCFTQRMLHFGYVFSLFFFFFILCIFDLWVDLSSLQLTLGLPKWSKWSICNFVYLQQYIFRYSSDVLIKYISYATGTLFCYLPLHFALQFLS